MSTRLTPYKFVVHPVVQRVDEDGNVVGEVEANPSVVFGCDSLAEWAAAFPARLAEAEANTSPAAA